MRSIESLQDNTLDSYFNLNNQKVYSITPLINYSNEEYEGLLAVIARGKIYKHNDSHDTNKSNLNIYYTNITAELIETISNAILFASKLVLLKRNIRINHALMDILKAFDGLNTNYVKIYNDLIKKCSHRESISEVPIEIRRRMLNIFLNVPSEYHNALINIPADCAIMRPEEEDSDETTGDNNTMGNSSANTSSTPTAENNPSYAAECRIWSIFQTFIKYSCTNTTYRYKLLYDLLLQLMFPLSINQTYLFIASVLYQQNDFRMKYKLKNNYIYKPVQTSYDGFSFFRKHSISRDTVPHINNFNKSCSEIFVKINSLNDFINKIHTGDIFIDVDTDLQTTLISNTTHFRSSAHREISLYINDITIHLKHINDTIHLFREIVKATETSENYSEYSRIINEMYKKIEFVILSIHNTIRCTLGYSKRKRSSRKLLK